MNKLNRQTRLDCAWDVWSGCNLRNVAPVENIWMCDDHRLLLPFFSSASWVSVCAGSRHDDRTGKRHGWVSVPNAEDNRLVGTGETLTNMKSPGRRENGETQKQWV